MVRLNFRTRATRWSSVAFGMTALITAPLTAQTINSSSRAVSKEHVMARSTTAVAAEILEAYSQARPHSPDFMAEFIEIRHEPPVFMDGIRPSASLSKYTEGAHAAYHKAMPDFRYEVISLTIDGDLIHTAYTLTGTPAVGDPVRLMYTMTYRVINGKIDKIIVKLLNPSGGAAMLAALKTVGYDLMDVLSKNFLTLPDQAPAQDPR